MSVGVWLGASYVLGRDVTDTEPYPHICGVDVTGRVTGRKLRVWRRDCAACQADAQPAPGPARAPRAVDPAVTATEHRRYADREE